MSEYLFQIGDEVERIPEFMDIGNWLSYEQGYGGRLIVSHVINSHYSGQRIVFQGAHWRWQANRFRLKQKVKKQKSGFGKFLETHGL